MNVKAVFVSLTLLSVAACSSSSDTATGSASGAGSTSGLPGSAGVSAADLAGRSGSVSPGSQQDLEVNVGDRVFFGFDSSVIDEASRQTLDRQATWLRQFPSVSVVIEGHADERGTREYNLALGERRAAAARAYLTSLGIEPRRIRTISYGEERPQDPGQDETSYALNRRAVTIVTVTN